MTTSTHLDIQLSKYMIENCFDLTRIVESNVTELNYLLTHRNTEFAWNGFNNVSFVPLGVSYDKNSRNQYFEKDGEMITIEEHWLSKYQYQLQYPDSPLVLTTQGEYLPVEAVWIRICLAGYQSDMDSLRFDENN